MQLEHEFTVPVSASEAWPVLLDIERIAPCMPGATVTRVDGSEFDGKVKVKVGPIQVTYEGHARFSEVDDDRHRAVIEAKGKEARGAGTAAATITAELHDEGSSARVTVVTDLAITGRPAQFGRGVMNDVGGKLLDRFATCLADKLGGGGDEPAAESQSGSAPAPAVAPSTPTPEAGNGSAQKPSAPAAAKPDTGPASAPADAQQSAPRSRPQHSSQDAEAIDLLEVAGGTVVKRLAPVLGGLLALFAFLVWRRRR